MCRCLCIFVCLCLRHCHHQKISSYKTYVLYGLDHHIVEKNRDWRVPPEAQLQPIWVFLMKVLKVLLVSILSRLKVTLTRGALTEKQQSAEI